MKNSLYILLIIVITIGTVINSCDFFDLDLTNDPNYLKPEDASMDGYLNSMQINMVYFLNDPQPAQWDGMNNFGMELCRMTNLFGATYSNASTPTSWDGVWIRAYDILTDANLLIPEAESQQMYVHAAMAKIISAYVLATMVDFFGDVPFSESFDPDNLNPHTDDDESLYETAFAFLDTAIADLDKASEGLPTTDLFYNGDTDKWVALAKSIKFKMLLNMRLINAADSKAKINALIADNDLIDEESEDFIFRYSTNRVDPDCRHPYFTYNYLSGANDYMSNYFIWTLYTEKGIIDPRIRYYFYRQSLEIPEDINELPCISSPRPSHYPSDMPFCALDEGYWGRDHLDPDGLPPDTRIRTVFGLYPAGGKFDDNSGAPVDANSGAMGAGIEVILLSSYMDFMRAEAALILGTTDNARDRLLSGVQKSLAKVRNFKTMQVDENYISDDSFTAYVDTVASIYDAATNDDERMEIIAKEYYIALFGNGVETYNLVRRTLKPANLQPALDAEPGDFFRTLRYPAVHVNLNANAEQKLTNGIQVFWDTNPANAIE